MPRDAYRIFLGFDAAEMRACNVAATSLFTYADRGEVRLERLGRLSLWRQYARPTTRMSNGQLYDEISGAPMSTDHAIARFFVPHLCGYQGWALFTDGDVLFRDDVRQLFALADPRCAVQVVQHPVLPEEGEKKAGHVQQAYPKKNWSSVCLFNCGHPANLALSLDVLNTWPGRDLHAFGWLLGNESLIGELPARWNYLEGVSAHQDDPALVHFTLGTPDVVGHETSQFADEWWKAARIAGYQIERAGVSRA